MNHLKTIILLFFFINIPLLGSIKNKIKKLKNAVSVKELKSLYHSMALQYHPDKGGKKDDFTKIKNAYDEQLESFNEDNNVTDSLLCEIKNIYSKHHQHFQQCKINQEFTKIFDNNGKTKNLKSFLATIKLYDEIFTNVNKLIIEKNIKHNLNIKHDLYLNLNSYENDKPGKNLSSLNKDLIEKLKEQKRSKAINNFKLTQKYESFLNPQYNSACNYADFNLFLHNLNNYGNYENIDNFIVETEKIKGEALHRATTRGAFAFGFTVIAISSLALTYNNISKK